MFLERIAIETPDATAALFELRDAGKWQAKYQVSADWLETFLRAVLVEGQAHIDWIKTDAAHLLIPASASAQLPAPYAIKQVRRNQGEVTPFRASAILPPLWKHESSHSKSAIDLYLSTVTRKGRFDGIRIEPWGACLCIARYHRDQQV
jgi:hypothetical protein